MRPTECSIGGSMPFSLSLADRPAKMAPKVTSAALRRWPVVALALAAVALPGVAYAEGGFDSYLSGVRNGYTSRQWTDGAHDNNSTTTLLSGCSRSDGAGFTLQVELRKRRSFLPDVSYGRKDVSSCTFTSSTGTWTNPGSGDFFDQFWAYDFGTVSASTVQVRY